MPRPRSDRSRHTTVFHGRPPRVAVVVSTYNRKVTDALRDGALVEYARAGGASGGLAVMLAPGSFELVSLSLSAAVSGRFDGVVALGCIVRGETRHDEYLARAVTQGLLDVTLLTGVPVSQGVLTVNSQAQALARAGGRKGNKGSEAMLALLCTLDQIARLNAAKTSKSRRRVR